MKIRSTFLLLIMLIICSACQQSVYIYDLDFTYNLGNPDEFYFKMSDKGCVPFQNGRAYILDVSNEHSVVNLSNQERVHMIVHGHPIRESGFQELIERSYGEMLKNPESFYA